MVKWAKPDFWEFQMRIQKVQHIQICTTVIVATHSNLFAPLQCILAPRLKAFSMPLLAMHNASAMVIIVWLPQENIVKFEIASEAIFSSRPTERPSSKPKWLKILMQCFHFVSEICTMMGSHFFTFTSFHVLLSHDPPREWGQGTNALVSNQR